MLSDEVQTPVKLSVVVITCNEECHIARCLESVLPVADEIVVTDSGSMDDTRHICEAFGAICEERRFVRFDDQKNWAVRRASYDYILSLDADEVLSDELIASIREVRGMWRHDCYRFRRINCFCGKWIRHGEWSSDRAIRLFDRRKAMWQGAVHERVVTRPGCSVGDLNGKLLHYPYDSIARFYHKSERYASMMAEDLYRQGKRATWFHLHVKPAYRFFYALVIRRGFLDGYAGYQLARLTAERLKLKFVKLSVLRTQHTKR